MKNKMAYSFILLTTFFLNACGSGENSPSSIDPCIAIYAQPLAQESANPRPPQGQLLYAFIDSQKVGAPAGITYPITIYLPSDYEQSIESYPIIYALDGSAVFSNPESDHRRVAIMANALESEGIKAIVIGIGNTVRDNNNATIVARRDIDYTMPGSVHFYDFITSELIPFIESQYRVNSDNRTISGHSLGGLFVEYALYMDRPTNKYFVSFIAQDGAFNIGLPSFQDQGSFESAMEQQMFTNSAGQLPETMLILSGATCSLGSVVIEKYNFLENRNYSGLNLYHLDYPNDTHQSMFAPSFRDSVRILFK